MAEQAQSDADDLGGLQEVPLDATQDPTDPATKSPYAKLIQELKEPDPPPGPPPPKDGKSTPHLQPERAKLLQNLLNAIPIASASQIAQMLQVFKPQNARPASAGQGALPTNPRPQNPMYPPPTRV